MECVRTEKAPEAIGPYSQAVKAGGFVFVSGQIPVDPVSGAVADTVEEQARQSFRNLQHVLEAAGSSLTRVVKTMVYIQNMSDFSEVNRVYAEFFSAPYPARACVEAAGLPKDVLLEVEAIAEN